MLLQQYRYWPVILHDNSYLKIKITVPYRILIRIRTGTVFEMFFFSDNGSAPVLCAMCKCADQPKENIAD
jgi:hypothetical protein